MNPILKLGSFQPGAGFEAAIRKAKAIRLSGFTLVELLVVVAVIAILASLLLPALVQAKANAKSAACKSNLRQLGFALISYVDDHHKYPGGPATFQSREVDRVPSVPDGALLYLAKEITPDLVTVAATGQPMTLKAPSDHRTVFHCPARGREKPMTSLFGRLAMPSPPLEFGYGYNALGTLSKDPIVPLGLGAIWGELRDADGVWRDPSAKLLEVTASMVRTPSDMIAVGDSFWGGLGEIYPPRSAQRYAGIMSIGTLHAGGANMVFCDGHVEYAKQHQWAEASTAARQCWNNDNQPHPQTW